MNTIHVNRLPLVALTLTLALAACGGDGGDSAQTAPPVDDSGAAAATAAATATAENNADCKALGDFYWEIGDANGKLASGSVGSSYSETTSMEIASASKWLYAAYVVEKRNGALDDANDVQFLNFTSGYNGFGSQPGCGSSGTVDDCLGGTRGDRDPAAIGRFDYDSGHMQVHASTQMGLGSFTAADLGREFGRTIMNSETDLEYFNAQIAGDGKTTPQAYARFLRRLLASSASPLQIGKLLGTHAVCTLASADCNAVVGGSPTTNDWHYSLGHWVEDDPAAVAQDNRAYSSAGAFGFYPWVDFSRTHYGIVARKVVGAVTGSNQPEGFLSSNCGKQIRLAYMTRTPQ
jgi:hypothetical protein